MVLDKLSVISPNKPEMESVKLPRDVIIAFKESAIPRRTEIISFIIVVNGLT